MKINYIVLIIIVMGFSGCSKFLDVTPQDKRTEAQLYHTKAGYYMALNGIYDGLATDRLYGRTMSYEMIDVMANRYTFVEANTYFRDLSTLNYASLGTAANLSSVWQGSYSMIMASNLLLDNLETGSAGILTPNEHDLMKGEALVLRAFLHFDMLRLFGPRWNNNPKDLSIPYNESHKVAILPLLPFEEVGSKIIRDLNEAEILLKKDPVIAGGPMAFEKDNESIQLRYRQFRFNYYAVKALKARVFLYIGQKGNALLAAKELLTDPKVNAHFPAVDPNKLLANATNPDRVFSSEVLMGIYVKRRAEAFTRYFSSETAGINFLNPHEQYVNTLFSFVFGLEGGSEKQDYRFQSQWETASGIGVKGHILTKYKAIDAPDKFDTNSEYFYSKMIALLRLSEVYYIAAECEPNATDGFKWLEEMRGRRGLSPIADNVKSTIITKGLFNRLLSNEYLREFNGEGQAFFFFKRLAMDLLQENGRYGSKLTYSNNTYRPPLPLGEIN